MAKDYSCQCQKSISCLSNYASYRWDIWPMQWRARCRDRAVRVLHPRIGSVLGHPPTDPLKFQVRKIVHVFMQHELCIQLSKEIQGISLLLCGGKSKTIYHLSIQLSINDWNVHHLMDICGQFAFGISPVRGYLNNAKISSFFIFSLLIAT